MDSDDVLPERVGAYRVVRRLATGGTSDVLLARAEGPHGYERVVVLKLLLQQYRENPQFERMFAREAAAYARLSHPAIVKLYDFFSEGGQLVMALEYIDGAPLNKLRALLRQQAARAATGPPSSWQGGFDDRASIYIMSRVFAALAAAHSARDPETGEFAPVIHRDVNPSNVLIPWDGHVKLADFGIAKVAGISGDTQAGFIKGTYGYMAPEQVKGDPVTVRADVYAASLLLWELLTRRKAIQKGALPELEVLRAMAEPQFPSLDVLRPDLLASLREALRRGLEPVADKRAIFAEELLAVLRSAVDLDAGRTILIETLAQLRPPSTSEDLSSTLDEPPKSATTRAASGNFSPRGAQESWPAADTVVNGELPPRARPPAESEADETIPRPALNLTAAMPARPMPPRPGQLSPPTPGAIVVPRPVPPPSPRSGPSSRPPLPAAPKVQSEGHMRSAPIAQSALAQIAQPATTPSVPASPAVRSPVKPPPPPSPPPTPYTPYASFEPTKGVGLGSTVPLQPQTTPTPHAVLSPLPAAAKPPPLDPSRLADVVTPEAPPARPHNATAVLQATPFAPQLPASMPPLPPQAAQAPFAGTMVMGTTPGISPSSAPPALRLDDPFAPPPLPAVSPQAVTFSFPPQPFQHPQGPVVQNEQHYMPTGDVRTSYHSYYPSDRPEIPVSRAGRYWALAALFAVAACVVVIGGLMLVRYRQAAAIAASQPKASASAKPSAAPPPRASASVAAVATTATAVPPASTPAASSARAALAPAVASVAPTPKPTATPPPTPPPAAAAAEEGMGDVDTSGANKGHRVWVDGKVVGETPGTFRVKCGARNVKVGSHGAFQVMQIPCGGSVKAGWR